MANIICSAEFNELRILLFAQCIEQAINIPDKIIGVKPQWQKKQTGKICTLRLMINTFLLWLVPSADSSPIHVGIFDLEGRLTPQHIHNMFWFIHHSLWNFDFAVLCVALGSTLAERAKFLNRNARSFCSSSAYVFNRFSMLLMHI